MGHHHRSGSLRQSNKHHKASNASKRSLDRQAGAGRSIKSTSKATSAASSGSKASRIHAAQQRREKGRQQLLLERRGVSSSVVVVGIVSLSGDSVEEAASLEELLRTHIASEASSSVAHHHSDKSLASICCRYNISTTCALTLLTNSTAFYNCNLKQYETDDAAIHAALDLVRVCDVVVFALDGNFDSNNEDDMMSERGERLLTALKAQGLPTPITALCCFESSEVPNNKKHRDRKKYAQRMAITEFGQGAKVIDVWNNPNDIMDDDDVTATTTTKRSNSILVRTLCHSCIRPCKWAHMRSHMVSDGSTNNGYSYNNDTKEFAIQGFLRGAPPLDVHSLVHVPHLGTFAIKCVMEVAQPSLFNNKKKTLQSNTEAKEESILLTSDPSKRRDSLYPFASPDALEGEQNLIGFGNSEDESFDGDDEAGPRPAGWSDYQASWLDALDAANDDDDNVDHGELGAILNVKSRLSSVRDEDDISMESMERAALLEQRKKEHKKELDFPDEVELKKDELARERFDRYRSLKSFRKSHWDPKENLPKSYADLYHFASFKATQNDVLNEVKRITETANNARLENGWKAGSFEKNEDVEMNSVDSDEREEMLDRCVASGSYVRVVLEDVPQSAFDSLSDNSLVSMVSLLPHENKISVLHMGVCQSSTCEPGKIPVKSKDLLTFRCGWRTWQGRPIFSQNNLNSDKHKFERFLPANAFVAASVFGPVTYTPCPVLAFREPSKDNARRQLVALGSIIGADADRVVIKRIVLTGYPVRVHKRHATVKYMFFNPEDVKWFKPAGLTSKHGLQGHIMESVGEHGTMKCLFNQPIKQHDTVCLPLYKRIYPKYASNEEEENSPGISKLVVM